MSLPALSWAWQHEGLDPTAKLTLLALADHHNESTGRCDPRVSTLAKRVGVHERTVQRSIGVLEDAGLVERLAAYGDDHRQRSNEFRLAFDQQMPLVSPRGDVDVTPDAGVTHEGDVDVTPPVTPVSPQEPEVEPEVRTGRAAPADAGAIVDLRPPSAQDVVATVVDVFAEHGVPIAERHRGMIGRQAADLLRSGFDEEVVTLAAITALRRGEPQNAHFIAADLVTARAGQRITRRDYERALQDEVELAGGRRGAA